MRISLDEAVDILKKWEADKACVHATLETGKLTASANAWISVSDGDDGLMLKIVNLASQPEHHFQLLAPIVGLEPYAEYFTHREMTPRDEQEVVMLFAKNGATITLFF